MREEGIRLTDCTRQTPLVRPCHNACNRHAAANERGGYHTFPRLHRQTMGLLKTTESIESIEKTGEAIGVALQEDSAMLLRWHRPQQ